MSENKRIYRRKDLDQTAVRVDSNPIKWEYDCGGRSESKFKGITGDCVVRAVAIATGLEYENVYEDMFRLTKEYRDSNKNDRLAKGLRKRSELKLGISPRHGVYREIYDPYLIGIGWKWIPKMFVGQGCKVHLKKEELPDAMIIARLSRHVCAVDRGVIRDIYDCSREGTRCVYGYYIKD